MNLKYYQVFTRVYESMNMSAVAEELFMTQPAVSRIIRELENHYGIKFFLRQSGRLYRTEGGERFYHYAKELLACEQQLQRAISDQKLNRKITLGVSPSVAGYYLPKILRSYKDLCGELDVRIYCGQIASIEQRLADARLDLAIIEGELSSWEVICTPLFSDKLVFVTEEGSAYLSPEQPLPLFVRDIGEYERIRFERTLRDHNLNYIMQGQFVDVEAIKQCAGCGLGVGAVPLGTIRPQDNLSVLDLPDFDLRAQFSLVYHRNKFVFPQLATFIDHLSEGLTSVYGRIG